MGSYLCLPQRVLRTEGQRILLVVLLSLWASLQLCPLSPAESTRWHSSSTAVQNTMTTRAFFSQWSHRWTTRVCYTECRSCWAWSGKRFGPAAPGPACLELNPALPAASSWRVQRSYPAFCCVRSAEPRGSLEPSMRFELTQWWPWPQSDDLEPGLGGRDCFQSEPHFLHTLS